MCGTRYDIAYIGYRAWVRGVWHTQLYAVNWITQGALFLTYLLVARDASRMRRMYITRTSMCETCTRQPHGPRRFLLDTGGGEGPGPYVFPPQGEVIGATMLIAWLVSWMLAAAGFGIFRVFAPKSPAVFGFRFEGQKEGLYDPEKPSRTRPTRSKIRGV